MAVRTSASQPRQSASPSAVLAGRIRVNELFVRWLASEEGADVIDVIVGEHLAAARQPPPLNDVHEQHPDEPVSNAPSSQASPSHFDPHTPVTPPHNPRPARPLAENTSPQRYVDRVDELDMRSSVGGASPVSPNQAVRAHAVDPHLPRSPDVHVPRRSAAMAGTMDQPPSPPTATAHAGSSGGGGLSSHASMASGSNSRAASPVATGSFNRPEFGRTASYEEIPRFLTVRKGRILGQHNDAAAKEIDALNHIFAGGSGSRRLSVPGSRFGKEAHVDVSKTLKRTQFDKIATDVFGVPEWTRCLLFERVLISAGLNDNGPTTAVRYTDIKRFHESHMAALTPNRRLFELIRAPDSRQDHLTVQELANAVKQLVQLHSCFSFLEQPEFQELYCKTVATRIVYHNERRQSRVVEWTDFDKSDVPELMRKLDQTSDINLVLRYFSYEHFYVLYCRFWELDREKTHALPLSALMDYGGGTLTPRVLERVVQGHGHRLVNPGKQQLDFEDFVFFCLSEEDKNSYAAKRYWFNVVDLDADGIISGHEMAYFFEEQIERFEAFAAEDLKYEDMLCQMLDMFVPSLPHRQGITFDDIRDCETAEHFFNMLFNATKFWNFEHRDPFAESQQRTAFEKTAWDRFARAEYDRMAQEAGQ
eukprot:CAMPEP_0174840090 /NCGR_PEP_ID=MMETSP1114-20130205/8470_1 /TAXON_ID=312471 /ORGANISM="Neobodo designis, Strain CCAP 1951/1" /LENGTH=647 /DNA_ID=CAMNT_0016074225 /DNA_START=142 /DNA_END=2085 /DNA_ORIENTATION=-